MFAVFLFGAVVKVLVDIKKKQFSLWSVKSVLKLTVIVGLTFLSVGCATNVGNRNISDFGRYMNLEKNVSTKKDVFKEFGQPHDVNYIPNDESIWTYYYSKMTMSGATFVPFIGLVAGGSNTDTTISDFYFNVDGKYSKLSSSNSAKYVNQWVGIAKGVKELATDKKHVRVEKEMQKLELPFDKKTANSVKDIGITTK
jgi:hypothetical protein